MALLAAYLVEKQAGETLEDWLAKAVFADTSVTCLEPDQADAAGFDAFLERFQAGLQVERAAPAVFPNVERDRIFVND